MKSTELLCCPEPGEGGENKTKLRSANNEINKCETVSVDDRLDSDYLMWESHYSVKANVGATVTVSAVLAVGSIAEEEQ